MANITWRNVNRESTNDAVNLLSQARGSINSAGQNFDSLGDILSSRIERDKLKKAQREQAGIQANLRTLSDEELQNYNLNPNNFSEGVDVGELGNAIDNILNTRFNRRAQQQQLANDTTRANNDTASTNANIALTKVQKEALETEQAKNVLLGKADIALSDLNVDLMALDRNGATTDDFQVLRSNVPTDIAGSEYEDDYISTIDQAEKRYRERVEANVLVESQGELLDMNQTQGQKVLQTLRGNGSSVYGLASRTGATSFDEVQSVVQNRKGQLDAIEATYTQVKDRGTVQNGNRAIQTTSEAVSAAAQQWKDSLKDSLDASDLDDIDDDLDNINSALNSVRNNAKVKKALKDNGLDSLTPEEWYIVLTSRTDFFEEGTIYDSINDDVILNSALDYINEKGNLNRERSDIRKAEALLQRESVALESQSTTLLRNKVEQMLNPE